MGHNICRLFEPIYACLVDCHYTEITHGQVSDKKYRKLLRKIEHIETQLEDADISKSENIAENLKMFNQRQVGFMNALQVGHLPVQLF